MATDNQSDDGTEKQHKFDVFREGDRIPWFGGYAVVVTRDVRDGMDDIPDSVADHLRPGKWSPPVQEDAKPVVLWLEREYDESGHVNPTTATVLARDVEENFSKSGLPSVRAEMTAGLGDSGRTRVQTPATGDNTLTREQARDLAVHLRAHSHFEPLYALLGGVESSEDMEAVADALERAADVRDLSDRLNEDD